jgi:tripartite-type tricarboxylate transporter receptor subunit TctC
MGHIKSGKVRALAVTTSKRWSALPDVPTVAEAGVPGFDSGVWYGIAAPAGTPRDLLMKLNADLVRALKAPDYRALLDRADIEPIGSSPEELGRFIKSELAKYAKLVKDAHMRID